MNEKDELTLWRHIINFAGDIEVLKLRDRFLKDDIEFLEKKVVLTFTLSLVFTVFMMVMTAWLVLDHVNALDCSCYVTNFGEF